MARIRNIKPDFWTDEKLVELEAIDRLLFIGIWNFADDEGYVPFSPKRIKMQVFPGDSLDISRGLQNLISARLLSLYDSEAGKVLRVTNWAKHQKVSNPTASKYSSMDLYEVGQEPRNDAESAPETTVTVQSSTEVSRGLNTEGERGREVKKTSSTPSKEFEEFWKSYPRKVGKGAAIKAHAKALKTAGHEQIQSGVESLRISVAGKDPKFTPHPSTWLNEMRWEDEAPEQVHGSVVPAQYGWANR